MTTETKGKLNYARRQVEKALQRQMRETWQTIQKLNRVMTDLRDPYGEAYDNGDTEALAEIDNEIKRINDLQGTWIKAFQDFLEKEPESLK